MLVRASLIAIVFLLSTFTSKANDNYALCRVKPGENIETLLKRYLLTPHVCNINTFIEINNLKNKDKIYSGKLYKLPLAIRDYNGINIRSSIGISDFETAKKIEKLNLDLLDAGIRDQNFKNNKKIWVPISEFDCKDNNTTNNVMDNTGVNSNNTVDSVSNSSESAAYTPTGTQLKRTGIKTINVPLMGAGYDVVHIEDFSLAGQVFYIIGGHGGPDPGAVYKGNNMQLCEDEYAYDVALRLARNLMQHGAIVEIIIQDLNDGIRDDAILMCDTDELTLGTHTIPLNQKTRLRERVAVVNKLYDKYKKQGYKVHKAIEIHVDSRSRHMRQDVFFYYNQHNPASKTLAENIQNVFAAKYDKHQKNRGYHGHVEDRGIYMVRNIKPDMVFVELANITNEVDQKRLLINTNRQALANWLFEGLRK